MRVEGSFKPELTTLEFISNDIMGVTFRENITSEKRTMSDDLEYEVFIYDEYRMIIPSRDNLEKYIQDNFSELLELAKSNEYDYLAKEIRKKRDILLAKTDSMFAIDHLGLNPPIKGGISDWIKFFKEFGAALTNNFAKYRQALRDVPQQPGFPYDITWPEMPEK